MSTPPPTCNDSPNNAANRSAFADQVGGGATHRSLAKSAGKVGFFTGVSRVLGFFRDLVIAHAFGTGIAAEAFVVSFKIPNLLRDLVGEGAMNSAFVPVLTERREKEKDDFWRLVSTLFFVMALILLVLSVLGILFAPKIVQWMAPGFVDSADPDKFPLTVRLTRVISPYIFFIGLSALAMGVLNSIHEFTSSALGPILLNISMIAAGIFFEARYGPMALVVGVLLGGVLQLGCQFPALCRRGFHWVKPNFRDPSIRQIGRLLVPRAMGSAVYQINVFVDSILASFDKIVGPGGQSALYYSNRLFQLPLAIFGVSLAQVILPTFSTQIFKKDLEGFKQTFSLALRSLMWVALPASVGLVVLCRPIIRILFERGRFDATSTQITSDTLFFYGFGLLSCCFIKVLVNAFYAMQDTKTPVKTLAFAVALNVALSLIFMRIFKIAGLALASSISTTVNAALLYYFLRKKIGSLHGGKLLSSFFKIITASLAMGAIVRGYHVFLMEPAREASHWIQGLHLFASIAVGLLVYIALSFALGIEEVRKIFRR